jgi:hypothetical protein
MVLPGSLGLARLMREDMLDRTVEILISLTREQYTESSKGTSEISGCLQEVRPAHNT